MPVGKLASQACHASKNCLLLASQSNSDLARIYQGPNFLGTQIILKSKGLDDLLLAFEKAKAEGIISSLIIDSGHILPPHFNGEPIITALGLGPCTKEQVHHITKKFKVV